ncbi:low temperature requirement protein A [Nocardioides convexus]|uniref:low temperature requirement protein A n=1 Tax=Nocardioides convexus TaxID=2712224 RepID=UPI0024185B9F|nr:low temperature requirement protein A [Nocardioides convexus]
MAAFAFATFGISWAWINFTWFASAYDTDDWVYRITTMMQMVGVLIFALGIKPMFESVTQHGETLDNDVIVWGYVVMRVAMILQWLRAGRHDPERRAACRTYVVSIALAQVLWCVLALVDLSVGLTFALMVIPFLVEIGGPAIAESAPRRHALARPPHRRALRPDGHHHPRRGDDRHDGRDQRPRRGRPVLGDRAVHPRRHGTDLRHVVVLLRRADRRGAARAARALLRVRLRRDGALRLDRRHRCRAARRRLLPGAPQRDCTSPGRCSPSSYRSGCSSSSSTPATRCSPAPCTPSTWSCWRSPRWSSSSPCSWRRPTSTWCGACWWPRSRPG